MAQVEATRRIAANLIIMCQVRPLPSLFSISPILLLVIDFSTILLVFLVRECPDEAKSSFVELIYQLIQ